jgi:hypothetical protein
MITNLIPPTTSLVAGQTDEEVNMRVRRQTEANVTYYGQGGAQAIVERLRELDREWDVKQPVPADSHFLSFRDTDANGNRAGTICPESPAGRFQEDQSPR